MVEYFDIALICENGHIINDEFNHDPIKNSKFCKECGAPTVNRCERCGMYIRGYQHIDGFALLPMMEEPNYCHECGEPYPWTKLKLQALEETVDLINELSPDEKEDLILSVKDISTDNPRTKLGVLKIKEISKKVGIEVWAIARDIITDIASETAKKMLVP